MSRKKSIRRSLRSSVLPLFLLALAAFGCSSVDSGSPWNGVPGTGVPAAGSTIDVSGGEGTVGSGGDGDQETGIWFDNYGPGGVNIYRSGAADASFTLDVPAATPDLGTEPLTVASDMTIPVYDADPADDNVYYFRRDDSSLYHKIDDATTNTVTGIHVNAGATLTLGINTDRNSSGLLDTASLSLANDLEVLGTLRSAAFDDPSTQESGESIDRAGLAVDTSGGIFIGPAGVVSTAGDNAATGRGGDGGTIELVSYYAAEVPDTGIVLNEGLIDASGGSTSDPAAAGGGSGSCGGSGNGFYLYAEVRLVNTGTIRAAGGNGGVGGNAGGQYGNQFRIASAGTLQNAGPVTLSGGTGSNGDGGSGGYLEAWADAVSLHNAGAVTTRGGNGSVFGGPGGTVSLYVNNVGDLLNSGAMDARGGDSTGTDNAAAANGGRGGQVYLYTYGGRLATSGPIDASGGGVANANAGSAGGAGGYVDIESYPDYFSSTTPAGAMEISGNILARGGAGPNGGYGGGLYVYYEDGNGTGGIVLRGYSSVVDNGGRGVGNGGGGGGIYLYDDYSGGAADSGGFLAEADISANGGSADPSAGTGGYGGYVEFYSSVPPSVYEAVTADGGTGASPGSAGTITIDGGTM